MYIYIEIVVALGLPSLETLLSRFTRLPGFKGGAGKAEGALTVARLTLNPKPLECHASGKKPLECPRSYTPNPSSDSAVSCSVSQFSALYAWSSEPLGSRRAADPGPSRKP